MEYCLKYMYDFMNELFREMFSKHLWVPPKYSSLKRLKINDPPSSVLFYIYLLLFKKLTFFNHESLIKPQKLIYSFFLICEEINFLT